MKKSILILLPMILLTSCSFTSSINSNNNQITKVSIIAPDGTPSLGLMNFYQENKDSYSDFDIVSGSEPLVAAFTSGTYDIIVAPTNLGSKMYTQNQGKYLLYETFVWGNLFIASKNKIQSLEDLNGKEVTVFGQNQTPDIIMKSLIASNNLDITLNHDASDVATANSLLMADKAEYIVSAQPSLAKLKKNAEIYTIDLQEEWKKMTNGNSYPQASIFFKKDLKGKIDNILEELTSSVEKTISSPVETVKNAIKVENFEKIGESVLVEAIPECHYQVNQNEKEAIETYFSHLDDLNLSAQYGGTLPNEEFYYSI